jgi:hypothetical protein
MAALSPLFVDFSWCYLPSGWFSRINPALLCRPRGGLPAITPRPVYPSSAMAPTRSSEELDRAAARARRKRRRRALIRDAVLALVIALILFGAWKAIAPAFTS